jgi:hypothetical protein
MEEPVPQIECPIDLFPRQEVRIQDLTHRINEAKEFPQKAELARAYLGEVEILLTCRAFDKGNVNCVNCQAISRLRQKVADLIVRAEKSLNRAQKE